MRTTTFTPSSSNTYYFAWNAYSLADEYYLDLDDITITAPLPVPATFAWTSTPSGFTSSLQKSYRCST
ncbi:MAG: hypothetical protein IPL24_05400 [Bacteroidetes bacterium]|nr:hypothetical protein [Bacteroidota bacterium]